MRVMRVGLLALALLFTPLRAQHGGGDGEWLIGADHRRAQHDDDHEAGWEWAGAFDLHSSKPYTLSFIPNLAHMRLLLVPSTTADLDGIEEAEAAAGTLWEAGVAVVEACAMTVGTAAAETATATTCTLTAADAAATSPVVGSCAVATGSGTCVYVAPVGAVITEVDGTELAMVPNVMYELHLDADSYLTLFRLNHTAGPGDDHYVLFLEHLPSELEGSMHWLKDAGGTDAEPEAVEEGARESHTGIPTPT